MAEGTKPVGLISIGTSLTVDSSVVLGMTKAPGIGGNPEKVEVTDLMDTVKRYINGVADNGELEYEFNYDNSSATSNFRVLKAFEKDKKPHDIVLKLPDGTSFKYKGLISVGTQSIEAGKPIKFNMTTALTSDVETTDPLAI